MVTVTSIRRDSRKMRSLMMSIPVHFVGHHLVHLWPTEDTLNLMLPVVSKQSSIEVPRSKGFCQIETH